MNGRRTGGSRLWPSDSNEIRWCNAGCPSLPACLERNPPACRQWPDAQPDAVWADSASGTWHSPMAIFPASHQRIRWLSAGGWGRKNWRVFGGPPMYAIWVLFSAPRHQIHYNLDISRSFFLEITFETNHKEYPTPVRNWVSFRGLNYFLSYFCPRYFNTVLNWIAKYRVNCNTVLPSMLYFYWMLTLIS